MSRTEKLFRRLDELEAEYQKLATAELQSFLRGGLTHLHTRLLASMFPFPVKRAHTGEFAHFERLEKEIEALRVKLGQPIAESPAGQIKRLLQLLKVERQSGNGLEFPLVRELLKHWGHES